MQDNGLKWLHKSSVVVDGYNPGLLEPISRSMARGSLNHLNFFGCDIWQAYEVSYLMPSGCPKIATLTFKLDAHSDNVVESKSLKLYLNSLNNHMFKDEEAFYKTITCDLRPILGESFSLEVIYPPFAPIINTLPLADWNCLDTISYQGIEIPAVPDQTVLKVIDDAQVSEKLYTMLFRANCLVTNQPDWATVMIEYEGSAWDKSALMAYLISYRNHQGFHEQCVDRIYSDITEVLNPKALFIQANFMRRGGIDITPVRTNKEAFECILGRDWRQ